MKPASTKTGQDLVEAGELKLVAVLKLRKLLILRNTQNAKSGQTAGTRLRRGYAAGAPGEPDAGAPRASRSCLQV
jgi:hypothetical protein